MEATAGTLLIRVVTGTGIGALAADRLLTAFNKVFEKILLEALLAIGEGCCEAVAGATLN